MQTLWQDLRFSLRVFRKAPGFTLIAVLSIALGIAANTSVFTLVNAMLFKPMPVPEPERLVALYTTDPNSRYPSQFSFADYKDYRDNNDVFSDLFVHTGLSVSLREGGSKPELIWGELVTGNYFTGLGVTPRIGRVLTPSDDRQPGAHSVAVLNHTFWQKRFGGDANVIGKMVKLNGYDFTIIGVARPGFSGTRLLGYIPDVWLPLTMHTQVGQGGAGWLEERGNDSFNVNGRLKPGVSIAQATAAMNIRAQQLAQAYPQTNANKGVGMVPGGSKTQPAITLLGFIPLVAGLMMGVVGLVLLITCANVANLLLARASTRRRELAIRLAIGARRSTLIRQLLTESLLLALLGGALGSLLAWWAIESLGFLNPALDFATTDLSYDLGLDHRILGFTLSVTLLTGVIFGLLPALQASKPDLVPTLKGEATLATMGRHRFNLRNLLVVAQVALALMLLICAGLFVKSLRHVQNLNPGFETERIVLASVNVGLFDYTEERGRSFYKQIVERIKTLPGVEAASLAGPLPLDTYSSGTNVIIEGRVPRYENERLGVNYSTVGHDYFQTMNTPLVQGRSFTERDDQNAPRVVIINETMASRYWPQQNPLGKRLQLGGADSPYYEVVGVARDGKYILLGEPPTEYMFLPLLQRYDGQMTLLARTSYRPETIAAAIRQEVATLDSELPVYGVKTMPQFLDRLLSGPKSIAGLVSIFGLIALLIAAIGLYGVMSYAVAERTREIGIRLALGARAGDVLRLTIKQGMTLVLLGTGAGLLAALALTRLMASLLYGVSATDPLTFIGVAVLLALIALLACFIPARRATKVDPMIALRYE